MDKGDQELMFGPAYYGDPGVPHGDPEVFLTLIYGYLFARAYKWVLKDDAARDHSSPFDHWLVAENSRLKRQWEALRNYKEGSKKKAPSVRDMSSAGEPRGKWDRVMMSGHFHMPSFQAYPHDFVYPQEKGDRPSNLPHLIPPHREIPLHDFQANTLEEDEYVLKAMELVGNDDLAPGEEGFDEEDKLAFMRAKLERKKLEMPENKNKVNLNELLEQTLDKDEAWQEEYVQAFSDIDEARLAAQEQIPLGRGEEFILEKASEQLPPEKISDYTEAQLRGEEQMEMKKRVLTNPRFDDRGEPLDVKKRREIARARIQADAEKKREAYVQRVQALESKLDKLDAEAAAAEAAGDPAAEKKVAAIEKAEQELQALQDAQSRTESAVKEAIENFGDDDFVLYGKEQDPDQEWWEKREQMRAQQQADEVPEYYDEDDVEVAHRLHVRDAEKGGIDPIDAEFETDFTPEEQALINFQDETPMYPTLGIVRGNANTALRPQRLVDKSGVVFDTVDEEIRTHSRLTLDPTQEDPRFQEWRYRLLGKEDGVNGKDLVPKVAEGLYRTAVAPAWEDFIPVITKPHSMLSRFFKMKMNDNMPPIATHDDDITPWGEESSANADLATYVERQLKVTGQKPDEKTLKDLGIGWFTRPDGAFNIPRGSRAAYERKERLAYEMYRADVAQRKTGPTFKALSRSEAVDKYFNKLGAISSELSAGEKEAPVPEFEEIPRYPGYLFASNGSGLGISPSGDYVVAMDTSNQLEAKTPKRVYSAAELKKKEPGVDWDGELKALGEAHGVEALAATKEERARILRQNAQRKFRERAARFKDLDDQDVEFLEASRERLRQRTPQEKRVGGKNVKELYAQHRQFSPMSAWTFINGLRSKKDTEQWNASDQRRRYDLETQGFVTEDAPQEEREHWGDKLKLFGPKSLTPLQREVVRGDQEKKKEDEKKWGVPGEWNMFKKAPREMLQPDVPSAGGRRGGEAHGGRQEEKGGIEIFGIRIGGAPKDRPVWETRKDKKSDKMVFFPREMQDEDPRERGIDRSGGKPRRKEFMRDADVRYPRLRDDYGIHEPDVREFVPQTRKAELTYEKDEDPVDPEFW